MCQRRNGVGTQLRPGEAVTATRCSSRSRHAHRHCWASRGNAAWSGSGDAGILMPVTEGHGPTPRRTATVAVLFCDLVGSTERQSRIGDEAADELRGEFFAALERSARASSGDLIKNTGDGAMVVFRESTVDAVACATAMHENVERLQADPPLRIRVGISAGEVASDAGDWFGTPVVEAARL